MELTVLRHQMHSMHIGEQSVWDDEKLFIRRKDVEFIFPQRTGMQLINVFTTNPGDSLRMGPVLDIVGMRCAINATAFPDTTDIISENINRTLHVIQNAAVTIISNISGIQDGIIDMQSPEYCPFAKVHHCVCVVNVDKNMENICADAILRSFQTRLAEFLAGHCVHALPVTEEKILWPPPQVSKNLPHIGMIYMIQSQGDMRRTYLYGEKMDCLAPQYITPTELLSGALISGNYVLCCNKTCTYIHHENPVIKHLLAEHGNSLRFGGIVLANEASTQKDKQSTAECVSALARAKGWQGVVVNQEGGGNADTDIMLLCQALEQNGIATSLLVNEFAGEDGRTPSLTEVTPEATHIVSTGNNDIMVNIPEAERCEGYTERLLGGVPHRALSLPLTRLYASTNQMGFHTLSCQTR